MKQNIAEVSPFDVELILNSLNIIESKTVELLRSSIPNSFKSHLNALRQKQQQKNHLGSNYVISLPCVSKMETQTLDRNVSSVLASAVPSWKRSRLKTGFIIVKTNENKFNRNTVGHNL